MSDKVCEIITNEDGFTYEEALEKAMDHTKKTKNETLFYFMKDAIDTKERHIENIFIGDCGEVTAEYPDKTFDGCFHTHPKEDYCKPSKRDIVSSIGYYNIIGCPHKRRKDTFTEFDLRLMDNTLREKFQDALEYECKEMFD